MPLRVDWLTDWPAVAAIAADWNALAAATDPTSVFLRLEWHAAAWAWLAPAARLAILVVRRADSVVGILPMVHVTEHRRGVALRVLHSMDIPDAQQVSLLSAAADLDAVVAAVVAELARTANARDTVQLRKLAPTTPNSALLTALSRSARTRVGTGDACPVVPLADSWEAYYARRSRRLKKGNNLIANRLRKAFGTVDLKRVTVGADAQGREVLASLAELSRHSWKRDLPTALHGQLAQGWIQALHRDVGALGALVVWELRLDGVLAAAELQTEYGGVVAALRAEVREDMDSHGPGTYLGWKVLEALAGTGRTEYNMGPGENEYKARWSETTQTLSTVDAYSGSWRGRAIWMLERHLKPALRRLRRPAEPPAVTAPDAD